MSWFDFSKLWDFFSFKGLFILTAAIKFNNAIFEIQSVFWFVHHLVKTALRYKLSIKLIWLADFTKVCFSLSMIWFSISTFSMIWLRCYWFRRAIKFYQFFSAYRLSTRLRTIVEIKKELDKIVLLITELSRSSHTKHIRRRQISLSVFALSNYFSYNLLAFLNL